MSLQRSVWITVHIREKIEREAYQPKECCKQGLDDVVIHKPMVFDIAFKKGDTIGTMRMDDEEFEVYIGHGEIGCVEGTQKRKFTIIEV